jgi:hypothetical protein
MSTAEMIEALAHQGLLEIARRHDTRAPARFLAAGALDSPTCLELGKKRLSVQESRTRPFHAFRALPEILL